VLNPEKQRGFGSVGEVQMHSGTKAILQSGLILAVLFAPSSAFAQARSEADRDRKDIAFKQPMGQTEEAPSNAPNSRAYIIGEDDVLSINVWNEKDLTRTVPVRTDGKISLPLVGEMQAAGQTPFQLEQEITATLRNFITSPTVAVIVEKINSKKFNILGEVAKPGSYSTALAGTIVDAIALAGGFRDFANKRDIYVLRQAVDGTQTRIRFNYKEFIAGKNIAQNINLEPHDTIIVR
jgi:polysaccharide biosynthesis/export protein